MSTPRAIDGYDGPEKFEHAGVMRWVYTRGQGPAVVLLHELPGLTVPCRELADRLAAEGYRVYMPLIVGQPEARDLAGNLWRVCISREIHIFSKRGMGPMAEWVRALCRKALAEQGGPGVGLIGMCLTGNFTISLIADPEVIAPVTCQPSLPVGKPADLAMTDAELSAAKAAAAARGEGALLGFRYQGDKTCPAAKFERLRAEFGKHFDGEELPGDAHSTLTDALDDGALAKTFRFLAARLKGVGAA